MITAIAAASVVCDVSSWSLRKQSLVHFGLMLATVYPCLLLSGWFPAHGALDALKALGIFLLVGMVLWLINYVVFGCLIKPKS